MHNFSDEKSPKIRKPSSEEDIMDLLRANEVSIAPAKYALPYSAAKRQRPAAGYVAETPIYDHTITIAWAGKQARFTLEIKSTSTPKVLETAIYQAKKMATPQAPPIVVVPYLSPESMQRLQQSEVSGFDLCGNVLILDGGLYIWNGGQPNRFPESRPIKNVYKGRGSVFVRCFLLKPEFASLAELRQFALSRLEPKHLLTSPEIDLAKEAKLTASTASKVIATLVEDLVVERIDQASRLKDPRELISRLKANFDRVKPSPIQGRTSLSLSECWLRLQNAVKEEDLLVAATGLGSAAYYGAMAVESRLSLRASNLKRVMEILEISPTRAFPNVELILDDSEAAYFDCRLQDGVIWASPIQTLLELATAGPREQDSATRFENKLLANEVLS